MKDLFVLVADQDMVETLKALLSQHQGLRIRPITHQVERHLKRDPGCRMDAVRSLRPRLHHYRRAIVVLDRHGCGDSSSRETIQGKIEGALASKWMGRQGEGDCDRSGARSVGMGRFHACRGCAWLEGPLRGPKDLARRPWTMARWRCETVRSEGRDEGCTTGEEHYDLGDPVRGSRQADDMATVPVPRLRGTHADIEPLVPGTCAAMTAPEQEEPPLDHEHAQPSHPQPMPGVDLAQGVWRNSLFRPK